MATIGAPPLLTNGQAVRIDGQKLVIGKVDTTPGPGRNVKGQPLKDRRLLTHQGHAYEVQLGAEAAIRGGGLHVGIVGYVTLIGMGNDYGARVGRPVRGHGRQMVPSLERALAGNGGVIKFAQIGAIAKMLDPIAGKLAVLLRPDIAQPEIVVTGKYTPLLVGRDQQTLVGITSLTWRPGREKGNLQRRRREDRRPGRTARRLELAVILLAASLDADRAAISGEGKVSERQKVCCGRCSAGFGKGLRQRLVVKGGLSAAGGRVHQNKFAAFRSVANIPELIMLADPVWYHKSIFQLVQEDAGLHLIGTCVVFSRELCSRLR